MKKLLLGIMFILAILLVGCTDGQSMGERSGYLLVKREHFENKQIWVHYEDELIIYSYAIHGELIAQEERVYIYMPIEIVPFYQLANKNKVILYNASTYFYFVEAKDINIVRIKG